MSKKKQYWPVLFAGLTVLKKLVGYLRESVLAYFFGTSVAADALSMANGISEICMGLLTALGVAFLPIFSKIVSTDDEDAGIRFMNQLLTVVLSIGVVLGIGICLLAEPICAMVAPGFSGKAFALCARFLRMCVVYMVIQSLSAIFLHFLNYQEAYLLGVLAGMTVSPVQMIVIGISAVKGEALLGLVYPISGAAYLLVLWLFSRRFRFRTRPCIKPVEQLRPVFQMLLPVFFSTVVRYVNLTVDKIFGSYLGAGSVSALHYSFTIRTYFIEILTILVSTFIFPYLSKAAAERNLSEMRRITVSGVRYILILYIPITFAVIMLSRPILQFLLGAGAFDGESLRLTSLSLSCYILGVLGVALRELLQKVYYSLCQTKILMLSWIVTMIVNIGGNFLLVHRFGVGGLALATSLSVLFAAVVLYVPLYQHLGDIETRKTIGILFKCCTAGGTMCLAVFFFQRTLLPYMSGSKLLLLGYLLFVAMIGGSIYFLLLCCLRVAEVSEILTLVCKRKKPSA